MNPVKKSLAAYWQKTTHNHECLTEITQNEFMLSKQQGISAFEMQGENGEERYFRYLEIEDTVGNETDAILLVMGKMEKSLATLKKCAIFFVVLSVAALIIYLLSFALAH